MAEPEPNKRIVVTLRIPENVYKVLAAEALLTGQTLEENAVERLDETIGSWIESDWPQEMFEQAYTGKTHEEQQREQEAKANKK